MQRRTVHGSNGSNGSNGGRGRLRGLAAFAGLLACAAVVWQSSNVASAARAESAETAWRTGAVTLDDEPGAATFATAAERVSAERASAEAGVFGARCIEVTYAGDEPAGEVRLYTAAKDESDGGDGGAVLDTHLAMRVRMGDADDTCAEPKKATWTDVTPGQGEPIVALAGYSSPEDALPTGWTPTARGEKRAFQFAYASTPEEGASGDSVSIDFVWATQER